MTVPHTQYTRSGNISIAYQTFGEGPLDLIFIPGWVSNIEELWNLPEIAGWLRQLASFSRVILFDKRGTGLSDPVPERDLPDLIQRMEDLQAIMQATGCKKAAILGISEGGPMAALFAARYPEQVSHLILHGSYARWVPTDEYPWGLTRTQHERSMTTFRQKWGTPVGFHLMAPSVAKNDVISHRWAAYLRRSASPGTAIALYRMNIEIDIREELSEIKVPSLIIHRAADGLIEVEHSRFIHSKISSSQYLELPGADHLPWYGDTQSILSAVQTFVQGTKAQPNALNNTLQPEDITILYQVQQYLKDHCHLPITIKELAKKFGLNEFKLKQGFKNLFGAPVITSLTQIRLETACRLLQETDWPIEDIAEKVGYRHPNNFSAAFKRQHGVSPGVWRRNNR